MSSHVTSVGGGGSQLSFVGYWARQNKIRVGIALYIFGLYVCLYASAPVKVTPEQAVRIIVSFESTLCGELIHILCCGFGFVDPL